MADSSKRIILDGDVLVYRCGFAAQNQEVRIYAPAKEGGEHLESFDKVRDARAWCEEQGIDEYELDTVIHPEPVGHAINGLRRCVEKILSDLGSDNFVVHLSSQEQVFRYQIATMREYKGNRKAPKPFHYAAIRDYIRNRMPCVYAEGIEADDTMLIEANEAPEGAILVSIDKDLRQNPGLHYDFVNEQLGYVDDLSAMRNLYQQILSGDGVDNIPGCPGIGDKKAAKILAECTTERELFDQCLVTYTDRIGKQGSTDKDGYWYEHWLTGKPMVHTPMSMLSETANLVYLLRSKDDPGWRPPEEV